MFAKACNELGSQERERKARGAPWEARRDGAGRGGGGARPAGPERPRVPERPVRAGQRLQALTAAGARRAAWRQLFRHLRHSAFSGSQETRPGAPPRCPRSVVGPPRTGTRALEGRTELWWPPWVAPV